MAVYPSPLRRSEVRSPNPPGKESMPDIHKETLFNGKPTLNLLTGVNREGQEFWFSFGLTKARAILENIEAIKEFVKKHGGSRGTADNQV